MKTIFTTACVFPNRLPIHFLDKSAEKFGVNLQPYGMTGDITFRGWLDIKVDKFCAAANDWLMAGYTHVFYTDGRDSFLLAGEEEILEKYAKLGSPKYLISTEDQCYPFAHLSHHFPDPGHPWRYLGAGQFMGEIYYMVWMWKRLRSKYQYLEHENHDQGWLEMGYVYGDLKREEFVLDTGCEVFQCVREGIGKPFSQSNLEVRASQGVNRIYNTVTRSWPCALHFPGGYSDPLTGKDHVLEPAWKELGWL